MGILSGNTDSLVLVFDVGSSSVGGALFRMRESGVPKILFTSIEPIILEQNLDTGAFFASALKSLQIVTERVHKAGLGAPQKIFCVLSSPWYVSQTRTIKLEKNTPFIFTAKLADTLIQKEVTLFEEERLKEYIEAKSPVRPIELKNIKVMLNGYETANPINQKARELEMTIFISVSVEQMLQSIEDVVHKSFHFKDIKFSSFAMASFAVVRDMYINKENFLLIDIGGEVTDISMIKKNILRESVAFPLGVNFMVRGVASLLGCSLGEAKSYLSLFKDRHAADATAKALEEVLTKLKNEWLRTFQESLANISNDISIPATIYLATDKDVADFFCQVIKTEQFNQYTLTESNFKINFLGTEVFHGMAEFEDAAIRDPFLIIDSIYINRFFN